MLEFNVSESKISIDFKGIVNDKILEEVHKFMIKKNDTDINKHIL